MTEFKGCLPREATEPGDGAFPVFGVPGEGTPQLVPASDWQRITGTYRRYTEAYGVIGQRANSCTTCGARGALQSARFFAGLDPVQLSHGSVYGVINGGVDRGSSIDVCLNQLRRVGMAQTSVIDPFDWGGYYKRRGGWPDDWEANARRYRVLEAHDCPDWEHLVSAIQLGFPVLFGVRWSGGGGHAILGTGYKDGQIEILNSWGASWGDNGFGFLPRAQVQRGITTYGAWALRAATDPPNDGDI